jgi:hypothetical protein
MSDQACGAYYGTGEGAAICKRAAGHPPYQVDGIGHSPTADRPRRGSFPESINEADERRVEGELKAAIDRILQVDDPQFRYRALDGLVAVAGDLLDDWYEDHMR